MKFRNIWSKLLPELFHFVIISFLFFNFSLGDARYLVPLMIITYLIGEITTVSRFIAGTENNRNKMIFSVWDNLPIILIFYLLNKYSFLNSSIFEVAIFIALCLFIYKNDRYRGNKYGTTVSELLRQLILTLIMLDAFELKNNIFINLIIIMHLITFNLPYEITKGIRSLEYYFHSIKFTNNRVIDNQMLIRKIKLPLIVNIFIIFSLLISIIYPVISPIFLGLYLIIYIHSIFFLVRNKIFDIK